MNKILISVRVPGSGRRFEIKIPKNIRINDLTKLLIQAFDNLTDEDFNPAGSILCDEKTGQALDINMTAERLGITNGSELLLI